MKVTVAICTWNRAALLDQTLDEMALLEVPDSVDWELIVANNNCTDNTDEVIARHADRLPVRRLFEPKPGKSHALNLASAEARGELILWTDDDVLVDRSWLAEYVTAARQWPNAVFFGGPIEPWFDGQPPAWLVQAFAGVESAYAAPQSGPGTHRTHAQLAPYGANFAIRRATQVNYPYNTVLGPRPHRLAAGRGDGIRLAECWTTIWKGVRPCARVRHFIPKNRQNTRYLHS